MNAPECRVCGVRHWGSEHVWPEMPKVSVKDVLEASVEHVKSPKDRKAYLREYMREYMRKRRAKGV